LHQVLLVEKSLTIYQGVDAGAFRSLFFYADRVLRQPKLI
jgi:hypothetical protein